MTSWTSQKVMEAVNALACPQGCVKHDAIVTHTGLTGKQVATACAKLVEHRFLLRDKYSDDTVKPGCYRLTDIGRAALEQGAKLTSGPKQATGKVRPHPDCLRDRAWRLLRIRRKGSVPELTGLLMDAGSTEQDVARAQSNLQKFLRNLALAGYLVEMRREAPQSPTSNGAKRYLLTRDTGPLPPLLRIKHRKIFDQNESKHYDIER